MMDEYEAQLERMANPLVTGLVNEGWWSSVALSFSFAHPKIRLADANWVNAPAQRFLVPTNYGHRDVVVRGYASPAPVGRFQ